MLSLGLYVPRWQRADYPKIPEAGRIESEVFDPRAFKPIYPNPAFESRLPEDTYWAAKKVMAFRDDEIRAIVQTGDFEDARTVDWLTQTLIERRDKIGRAFFGDVLPLDGFRVEDSELRFQDLAVLHGFAEPRQYSVQWFVFDNLTEKKTEIPGANSFRVPTHPAAYLAAEISSGKSVTVYLRGSQVVGIDRSP